MNQNKDRSTQGFGALQKWSFGSISFRYQVRMYQFRKSKLKIHNF